MNELDLAKDEKKQELLRNTICKGVSPGEFDIFLHACLRTGLDPFMRQIYAVKRKDAMTIQTGIDGYRLIAERTGRYSPGKEPSYTYDDKGKLLSATAHVKKMTNDGTWHEVSATAFFIEYVQAFNGVPTKFWAQMPHNQLAKCAEALALRKAFPAELSGVYTKEEMDQADIPEADVKVVDQDPERIELYSQAFEEDDKELVKEYIAKWCKLHGKGFQDFFERYPGKEELLPKFNPWKEAKLKAG